MPAPTITTQPSPITATAGTSATFTAAASGAVSADLYRGSGSGGVYYGSNPVDSGGNVSITFPVSSSDQGNYFFAFRNATWSSSHSASDSTLTSTAALTVVGSGSSGPTTGTTPPTITGQPASVETNVGYQTTFSVIASTSAGALTYQWYHQGTAITGATGANYTISAVATTDAGSYYVIVGNDTGTVQSATVTLTVDTYPGGTGSGGTGGSGGVVSVGPSITYVGDASVLAGAFIDQYLPTPGKSEWGMDTLARLVKGIAPHATAYAASLAQGQQFTFNGTPYYLQSWEPDNNPVFPGFTLHYKGLVGGIPNRKADGQSIEQSITLSATFGAAITVTLPDGSGGSIPLDQYSSATREIRYITRSSKTRYITSSRPTGPTYGIDISSNPIILSSVITATDGTTGKTFTFSGANAPAVLVTALTPAAGIMTFMECAPVIGSPYFECTDSASNLYQGN